MMPGWNLGLRFVLELAAFTGFGFAGWSLGSGWSSVVLALVLPLIAATCWGTFAVPNDPSRSGKAPKPVSGLIRLSLELLVFLGGAAGFIIAGHPILGAIMVALVIVHHAFSTQRLRWLIAQNGARLSAEEIDRELGHGDSVV